MTILEQKRFCMQMIVHYEDLPDKISYKDLSEYYAVLDHCHISVKFWTELFNGLIDE